VKSLYYNFVKLLAKAAVLAFYSKIEVRGQDNIPKDSGHIIFAPNHQSAFLDAVLVAVFSKKPIHFLTRADVFTFPFKYLLYSLNMMPVYRQRDGFKTLSRNEAVFETCKALLRACKPILLFPEASQSLVYYLRPLSRGLSRIAYLTQNGFDRPVYIIPVGINYFDQFRAGGRLILNFGLPINVKSYQEKTDNKTACINELRDGTARALKSEILIPVEDAGYEEKLAYLNAAYYGKTFEELRSEMASGASARKSEITIFHRIPVVLFSLPNLPCHALDWLVIKFIVKDPTFIASIRVSLLMFVFPLWLAACFLVTGQNFNWIIAVLTLVIQTIGYCIWLKAKSKLL